MKISKLFHWLYAILMLLPFLVFLPNAFYYGFNEHAVAQTRTEQVPVYYESNNVNSLNDLHIGNAYQLLINDNYFATPFVIYLSEYDLSYLSNYNITTTPTTRAVPNIIRDTNGGVILIENTNNSDNSISIKGGYLPFIYNGYDLDLTDILPYIQEYRYYIKEYQPLTTNMSITDSMSYAWDSVWQNDLFSWSYGSFLTEPFIYIGNIFNVPVDNSLFYALSYWLDISIIWLTFDLLMYVPLLVHRWIDKGIVE